MSIPDYPQFRPLDIGDQNIFNKFFRENPPVISEYTFTNLYAWRDAYQFHVSFLDHFIILRSGPEQKMEFFPPIGRGDIISVMGKILADSRGVCIRAPLEVKKALEGDSRFKIDADRDSDDYLYRTPDLISLKGSKYDGKRNLIKKFKAAGPYEYVQLTAANVECIMAFAVEWCVQRKCNEERGLRNEYLAIGEMVKYFAKFNLTAGAIRIEGKITAMAISEPLNSDTLVMHVLKADTLHPGLYQVMCQEFLAREATGFAYVNLEEDLGVPGLRKAKMSYHPFRMIEKFKIRLG